MMAGRAISPLLKMNGEDAIAMACAAFCILTSITIVRRTAGVNLPKRDRVELPTMDRSMSSNTELPNTMKLAAISLLYCKKKTNANVMRAGNAILLRMFLTCAAG